MTLTVHSPEQVLPLAGTFDVRFVHAPAHAHRAFGPTKRPIDILQENMGHADFKTTAGYYQGELSRRAAVVRAVFDAI